MVNPKPSQEFSERKKLMELQKASDIKKYERTMAELEFRRASDLLHHARELERGRIKSAEIKKMQQRKADQRSGGYGGN